MKNTNLFSKHCTCCTSFQKGPRRDMIFLVLSGKMVFFFENRYLFLGQKMRDDFSQETHGNMISSVYTHGCYKCGATPLWQKKAKMVLSRKNTPKSDWRSRLTFQKELQQSSVLSSKKNQETYYAGLKFDFFLTLFG